ncbi:MAG: hypothetical protein KC547_18110, partial [Anaerolineae bacterium]|nr:hypothetical protein [Anaerolineae bacterium]
MNNPFASIALTIGAAFLFWQGLRDVTRVNKGSLVGGVTLLVVVCVLVGAYSTAGGLGVGVALMLSLYSTIIALVTGLVLAFELRGKRKRVAILISVIYPIMLFLSIVIGSQLSPEIAWRNFAAVIAQRLDQYRADYGRFPATLDDLVPLYLDDLREPTTVWGWLYTGSESAF